jgi:RimJ/RimL family protein N-acetyltransferase
MPDPLLADVPQRLETPRLVLRSARPGDGAALFESTQQSLARLRPWMPWAQDESTPEAAECVVRRMHGQFALRQDLPYLMFERVHDGGEGLHVGGTGLHRIDWTVPRFEIGYWVRSGFEGQGLVTEAVRALARLAFDRLRAARVEIRMDADNAPSRRVAERAGFTLEGILRRDTLTPDGRLRDTCVYSRVRGAEEPVSVEDA